MQERPDHIRLREQVQKFVSAFEFFRTQQSGRRVELHHIRLPGFSSSGFGGEAQFHESGEIESMRVVYFENRGRTELRLTSRRLYDLVVSTVSDGRGKRCQVTRAMFSRDGRLLDFTVLASPKLKPDDTSAA